MALSSYDVERAVPSLRGHDLGAVGSLPWTKQHLVVQKLNLLAHDSVAKDAENEVLEKMVSHDKIKVMCHELLVIEAWREKVLSAPAVLRHLALNFSIRGYHTAYHEACLSNLFEVVLYHDYAAQACGDLVVELIDYCVRRIRWLVATSLAERDGDEAESASSGRAMAAKVLGESDSEQEREQITEFCRQLYDVEWRSAIAAVSILRYLCEHVSSLPLGVTTRLIDTHDVPVLIIPLIENPPWTRRTSRCSWEKLIDHTWKAVEPRDLLMLTATEAQPWLVLFNLLCEGSVRQRYPFHSFRKEQILRVRKYLNPTLVDQLPVLADLQRVMDELVLMEAPPASSGPSSFFVIEQVAETRETMMKETDWKHQQKLALTVNFAGKEKRDDPVVLELAGLYGDSDLEALLSSSALVEEKDRVDIISEPAKSKTADAIPETSLAPPPEAPRRFPETVLLLLQTGTNVELAPVSQLGTEQKTSKGLFTRFQLRPRKSPASELEVNVSIPKVEKTVLKMRILLNDGTAEEVFSQPLSVGPEKRDAWEKLGSLAGGVLAQVHCVYDQASQQVTLGAAFLSLQA